MMMGRIRLAFVMFFRILFNAQFAQWIRQVLERPAPAAEALPPEPGVIEKQPLRSDSLTLLSVLQREGRLVDFLKEDLGGYSDAQIGAAARDVHRDCASALERMFALRPVRSESEGTIIDVPQGFDPARIRLTGSVAGPGPYSGAIRHAGWEAGRIELPEWSGPPAAARIVAPAEVEV
jgi:hypothetical protein